MADPQVNADAEIAKLRQVIAVLNAELTVAKFEVTQLTTQRDATRIYLGVPLSADDDESPNFRAVSVLRREVKLLLQDFGSDRKIQCIKELRMNSLAAEAWRQLGGAVLESTAPSGQSNVHLTLVDAKNIIDSAISGTLYVPTRGMIEL